MTHLLLVFLGLQTSCGAGRPPEALAELRRVVESSEFTDGSAAAPDIAAEAERSLALAEQAHSRGDEALARRMATLGGIQARITAALYRQQFAGERLQRAQEQLRSVNEDIARYRSRREDAEHEVSRLESLGRAP